MAGTPIPTATRTPAPTSTLTATPTAGLPAFIPPECAGTPLATVPVATTVALRETPTTIPVVALDAGQQLAVLEDLVMAVEEAYIYPDSIGVNWGDRIGETRAQIASGIDTATFYQAMEDLISGLGDEHSSFESPQEVVASDADLAGERDWVGIGVFAQPLPEKQKVTILTTFADSAAESAGLKPHDSLLSVDGVPIVEDGVAITLRVRGPECSAVVVVVQSPGEAPRPVQMVRRRLTSSLQIDARLVPTLDGSRVGYIFIPTFFDETIPDQVRQALEVFGPLDGLILDNRMNGGGSSSVVEPILALFTQGVQGDFVRRDSERVLQVNADPIHNSQTVPLVVLVGEGTVSYAEIVSGLFQTSGRAIIVGERTLGNVEVLSGHDFEDGSRAWLAEETFVPAAGPLDWESTGLVPDIEVLADWDTFTFETDPAIAAAIKALGH